ncbi:MAG TPA: ParB/RepB/Spo0J family partition protein, partial [Chloroflexota bacterium]|nr:ParB/RepB/Spo0J family partition protein [Chloroflexota bacterium]
MGSRAKKTAGKGRSAQAQEEVLRTAFTDGASADRSAKAGGAGEGPVENMMMIRADRLMPRADQPRNVFEPEALKELADSIDSLRAAGIGVNGSGILQPLTVRVPGEEERDEGTDVDKFQIIAGERRYRAGQSVGVTVFPCVLEERAGKDAAFEVALRENLQREDLSPLEAAVSINRMMAGQNVLGKPMSELEVSRHIGKHLNWVKDRRAVLRMDED